MNGQWRHLVEPVRHLVPFLVPDRRLSVFGHRRGGHARRPHGGHLRDCRAVADGNVPVNKCKWITSRLESRVIPFPELNSESPPLKMHIVARTDLSPFGLDKRQPVALLRGSTGPQPRLLEDESTVQPVHLANACSIFMAVVMRYMVKLLGRFHLLNHLS